MKRLPLIAAGLMLAIVPQLHAQATKRPDTAYATKRAATKVAKTESKADAKVARTESKAETKAARTEDAMASSDTTKKAAHHTKARKHHKSHRSAAAKAKADSMSMKKP